MLDADRMSASRCEAGRPVWDAVVIALVRSEGEDGLM